MSRTIRRKNYLSELGGWELGTIKRADYHMEWVYINTPLAGHARYWVLVEPTKEQLWQTKWWLHGESKHAKSRSELNKWCRRVIHKAERAAAAKELHHYARGKKEDVMIYNTPRLPMEYWW